MIQNNKYYLSNEKKLKRKVNKINLFQNTDYFFPPLLPHESDISNIF